MAKRSNVSLPLGALCVFGIVLTCDKAHADCATSGEYQAAVTANTVTVGPLDIHSARRCGTGIELLRQNLADGAVVTVGNLCDDRGQHIDECVPPGNYRYGYAVPFDCSEAGCGYVTLYLGVTVVSELASTCARTAGGAEPTPTETTVPWQSGDSGSTRFKKCDSGGGCGVTTSKARQTVRWLDLLAFGAGLGMMAMRSRLSRSSPRS